LHMTTQPIVFKWRQNIPSTGFASWSRIDTTFMHCATLGPVMLILRPTPPAGPDVLAQSTRPRETRCKNKLY